MIYAPFVEENIRPLPLVKAVDRIRPSSSVFTSNLTHSSPFQADGADIVCAAGM